MTLYEFQFLSQSEQTKVVLNGSFLMAREDIKHTIILYKVQEFYAEVYFHIQNGGIVKVDSFSSKMKLEPYLNLRRN
jgi:hypothetical protein